MPGYELNINDFDSTTTNLKNVNTAIVLLILETCGVCINYMKELDKRNIQYKYLKCNNANMQIISRIAKQLNITNLSVPLVLKYKNNAIYQKYSNKIDDINNLII